MDNFEAMAYAAELQRRTASMPPPEPVAAEEREPRVQPHERFKKSLPQHLIPLKCQPTAVASPVSGIEACQVETVKKTADQVFDAWDTNANGKLSHSQIKKQMKAAPEFTELLGSEGFQWKHLWDEYDANGNGSVEKAEFRRLYAELLQ